MQFRRPWLLASISLICLLNLGSSLSQAQTVPKKVIIVSDIDDTIRLTRVHPMGHYLQYVWGIFQDRAFVGMPALYSFASAHDHSIEYVSGSPELIHQVPESFLQYAGFPAGPLSLRPSLNETIEDFKYNKIMQLFRQNPDADFVLIGDNGEQDILTYQRLQQTPEVSQRIKWVLIHKLYPEGVGLKLAENQTPFFTAADLALQFASLGLIQASELGVILQQVDRGLDSAFSGVRERSLPEFEDLTDTDYQFLGRIGLILKTTENRDLYLTIIEKIKILRSKSACEALPQ